MKIVLLTLSCFVLFLSFDVKEISELTADRVVNNQTSSFHVNGNVSEITERRYSIRDTSREMSNEFHMVYDDFGQITNYTMDRMTHYSDKSVMEKSAQLNYFYSDEKLMMIESFSYRDQGELPDSSERSYIKYSYESAKGASYKAYRYGNLDHVGEIKVIDNEHSTEHIKYPKGKLKPVLYKKEYNSDFQLIKSEQHYVSERKKKVEIMSFAYNNGLLIYEDSYNFKQYYTYELDAKGNWIKRTTTLGSGNVVEELERDIIYR